LIKVGCCCFPMAMQEYFEKSFPVETQSAVLTNLTFDENLNAFMLQSANKSFTNEIAAEISLKNRRCYG